MRRKESRHMKKKLLIILITSLVMIGLMGAFLWKMNSISKKLAKSEQALLEQELDINVSDKAWKDISSLDIIPLYLSGDQKNVVTKDYNSLDEIYNMENSAVAEEMLTDIKKRGEYMTERPLWAYNPYGTNNQSLYLYFRSEGKCYCRYTISVENEQIPDFTRTLSNGASGNISEEHEYQIIGLVPGEKNYIILKLYNNKDELAQTVTYTIDMPKSQVGAQTILESEEGRSKVSITNGLYMVFQKPVTTKKMVTRAVTEKQKKKGKTVKKKVKKKVAVVKQKSALLLYDNSGVLRGEIPVKDAGINAEIVYDNLVYQLDMNRLVQINSLGQVVDVIKSSEYSFVGEFAYDGYGSIYTLGESNYISSHPAFPDVLKIELESGEVTNALFGTEIQKVVESHYKEKVSYPGIDSIQVVGVNQVLLSSSQLSSIFKYSNISSLMPKLDYVISDEDLWKNNNKKHRKWRRKKLLTKAVAEGETEPPVETPLVDSILEEPEVPEIFPSQYGQNSMVIEKDSSLAEGQYLVYMLNNNSGAGAAKGNENSYYYRYLVDENAGTYVLDEKERLEKNAEGGNVIPFEESYLYCKGDSDTFLECDEEGKLIKSFQAQEELYRVYKSDWKGFWFY